MQKCLDQDLRVPDLDLHELSTNDDFLGRFLMYGDIYCTDFTCTSYPFTSFACIGSLLLPVEKVTNQQWHNIRHT